MTLAILGFSLSFVNFLWDSFLGGSVILSFGWQPLLLNAFLYLIITIILLVDTQNSIKPMVIIPILGIVGSFIAFIPVVGMVVHWILFFLMIFLYSLFYLLQLIYQIKMLE